MTQAQSTPQTTITPPGALPPDLRWYDVRDWGVEGKGWSEAETQHYFDRLPARAQGVVREPVWNLSRHAAGLCVRFETDAPLIAARWMLRLDRPPGMMLNMAPIAASGLDLYGQSPSGQWRWAGAGRPAPYPAAEAILAEGLDPGRRAYLLYLPLFDGVESLAVGVSRDAVFEEAPPRPEPPIAFYGTSIVHGASASRPGMTHAAILGRRLDQPVLNLGFSGNGKMEPEVAALLAELDPGVYVVDCLPNMTAQEVSERAAPLVRTLRAAHQQTPIVLVEDRTNAGASFREGARRGHAARRAALRQAYETLVADGVPNLHYVPGERLLGDDGEATIDGSHPTDLGFVRMADALEPVLRPLL
jgi:lysophospholipase L1-like esterase